MVRVVVPAARVFVRQTSDVGDPGRFGVRYET